SRRDERCARSARSRRRAPLGRRTRAVTLRSGPSRGAAATQTAARSDTTKCALPWQARAEPGSALPHLLPPRRLLGLRQWRHLGFDGSQAPAREIGQRARLLPLAVAQAVQIVGESRAASAALPGMANHETALEVRLVLRLLEHEVGREVGRVVARVQAR